MKGRRQLFVDLDAEPADQLERTAAAIRNGINATMRRRGLRWCAYGQFSDFHLYRGDASPEDIQAGRVSWKMLKGAIPLEIVNAIRAGCLLHGVDISAWPGGFVSAAHTPEDAARTVAAFESTSDMLALEGLL